MTTNTLTADNGVSSGTSGIKYNGGNDGTLTLQTTTSGGTPTTALTIDNVQNVGVGVTPSAWGSGYKAIEFTGGNSVWTAGAQLGSVSNAYYDGTQWRAKTTGPASISAVGSAGTTLYTAASVSAGSVLSFVQTSTLGLNSTLALQAATSSAGTGIAFPATQNPSSDANTLDDYEEGTWTPVFNTFTVGNGSVTGSYVKVGKLVTVQFRLTFGTTSSFSGTVSNINGLPFTSTKTSVAILELYRAGTGWFTGSANLSSGQTSTDYPLQYNNTAISSASPWVWANSDYVQGCMSYEAS